MGGAAKIAIKARVATLRFMTNPVRQHSFIGFARKSRLSDFEILLPKHLNEGLGAAAAKADFVRDL